uniref:uncharacterized protein isoform X2 n=1 Tax=Semicossyphus pulcher TaxID=241346 RepID=UPI0037E7A237
MIFRGGREKLLVSSERGRQTLNIRDSNMEVRHALICIFLALREGNAALDTDIGVRTGTEGGNIKVECSFAFSGSRKIFCRDDCRDRNILVETSGVSARRGRYSIEYKGGTFSTVIYVSIRDLRKSDSGRYSCHLDRYLSPDSSETFELSVKDATPSASTGSSTPSSASPENTKTPQLQTPAAEPTTRPLLYLGLILGLMIIVLSVSLLIFCRKRDRKPKGPPDETEYANIQEANRVYDEIKEGKSQSRSPAEGISTVYTYAKCNKPTDDYSRATAAGFQNTTEDDPDKLDYSEVDFSVRPAASLHSAPSGEPNNVIYSAPRAHASAGDASPALYSTVTLH